MNFSLIIPVYNSEKYIKRCLDSVLNQNYDSLEIIIVNDCSTDGSGQICKEYADNYNCVKLINNNTNLGVSKSREIAIDNSTGDYLIFLDSDDYLSDDYFSSIVPLVGPDIIRFGNFIVTKKGIVEALPNESGLLSKEEIIAKIFPYLIQGDSGNYYCPSLWAHAFKRELFANNMLRGKSIKIGEDGACVIPCIYNADSIYFLNKCLYYYVQNDGSATKSTKAFDFDYPEQIINHLNFKMDLSSFGFEEQVHRKVVHELFHVIRTQFYLKEKYIAIKKNINNQISSSELYLTAIKQAHFKSLKGKILLFALKHRMFFLFKIYSKIG